MATAAMHSLQNIDMRYPIPRVYEFLSRPENEAFLDYVFNDPFGCHIFPGDIENYPHHAFLEKMNVDLQKAEQIHLWSYIPACRYRCHFCQYPVIVLNPQVASSADVFREIVDLTIQEALMWLEQVPSLASTVVGEFNVFGGTPSLLPQKELCRLMDFYVSHFNFSQATMRFEGEPGSLTKDYLKLLKSIGFSKISFGAQSFNDRIIAACGRRHSAQACIDAVHHAREVGFDWVSVDLIYGMLGQGVDDVQSDMEKVLELELSHVVCAKLHMESFMKRRTGVSGERESLWQKKGLIDINGMAFPGLGKQYQMREVIERYLSPAYYEHPTMYFHRRAQPAEKWKALITDLDKQYPEVAIGPGGSSKCWQAESVNITDYKKYKATLNEGHFPVDESRGISSVQREVNAFKMALSTLIPVDNSVFRHRFSGRSFFDNPIICRALDGLINRSLLTLNNEVVTLTPNGVTLVEAIINTQFTGGGDG